MSLLAKADLLPPCICRLIARKNKGRQGRTNEDIARESGLSLSLIKDYCFRTTWKGLPIDSVDAFARGCGINLMKMERDLEFLRRRKWVHIENARGSQREFYKRLMQVRPQ